MIHLLRKTSLVLTAALLTPIAQPRDSPGPQPMPLPPPIAPPIDTPYVGTIQLSVDVTDVERRILRVHEIIPVEAGPLTLLYPKWIPGNHSPTGPISKLSGLVISSKDGVIPWMRDRIDVYAFHLDIPPGTTAIEVNFDYLAPLRPDEGRISMSSKMIDLAWNTVVLYPAGHFARCVDFLPRLKLPPGWQFASALQVASHARDIVKFKETSLNTLVDSPVYAGLYFKRLDLSTDANNRVFLDVVADKPAELAITPQELDLHRNLVRETAHLFRSRHYDHYDFLFLLSDTVGGIGLEHHQSSEDGTKAKYFTDWEAGVAGRDLLAHEYTHSWNGKFRRPADLWTPNFNVPMQDDLVWVYEGLTQYYGLVLTARSGLRSADQTRDVIAQVAANFDISAGRSWRPLVDTTNQPTISQRSPVSWVSWQRGEDYYQEGMLIWLDADTKIRALSSGHKSLDDFARAFFGVDNGSYITKTYTLDDIVRALNDVQPFDWKGFFEDRAYRLKPKTPVDGIIQGGYRLAYTDALPDWRKRGENATMPVSFSTSLGISVKDNGDLGGVWWDSPAFKAGITQDMHLTAVNGQAYTKDVLRSTIVSAEKDKAPIKLLLKRGDEFQTFELDYHGGLRYPKLERMENTPGRLDDILAASK